MMKLFRYLLIFTCFLPILLFRDFTPNNELKYLSIADEALENGYILTFRNHEQAYADKPPLYLWIVMAGKWLFDSHNMFFLSLFSIVPALLILYIMDQWTRQLLLPSFRKAGQLMLITSGLFTGAAIVLRMDMLMSLFILLSLYSFFRIYTHQNRKRDKILLPIYIFLAIFTKGPVGMLVPLLTIFMFLLLKKELRLFGKFLGFRQWGLLLGLCLPWFGGVYIEGGKEYLDNLLFHQTVNRAVDAFHHKEPVWFYLKTIWYSLAPWSLFYLCIIFTGIGKRLINTDVKKLFLTCIATTFITLSLFSGKLDIYLLPVFPFIAYLCFILIPDLNLRTFRFSLLIPAMVLTSTLPALFLIAPHIDFPLLHPVYLPLAASILSASGITGIVCFFKNRYTAGTNSLSIGILLAILTGGLSLPTLNKYIGYGEMCRKAQSIARQNGINNYYYYNIRSGENMDSYLNQKISPIRPEEIEAFSNKQAFILFVRDKDLSTNTDLQDISQKCETCNFKNYSIIIVK